MRDVHAHADRLTLASANESTQAHAATLPLDATVVIARVSSREIADEPPVDLDPYGEVVMCILGFADKLHRHILKLEGFLVTPSRDLLERVLAVGLADHL